MKKKTHFISRCPCPHRYAEDKYNLIEQSNCKSKCTKSDSISTNMTGIYIKAVHTSIGHTTILGDSKAYLRIRAHKNVEFYLKSTKFNS